MLSSLHCFIFLFGCGISSLLVGGGGTKQLRLCSLHVNMPTVFTLECDRHRNYYHNSLYQLPLHFDWQCNCVLRVSESRYGINQLVCNGDAMRKRLMTRTRLPYKRFCKPFV